MSKLSLYIPTKWMATLETPIWTELSALKLILSGSIPFQDTQTDRENPVFTLEIFEANANLKVFSENPDRITREVTNLLAMRGVDQKEEEVKVVAKTLKSTPVEEEVVNTAEEDDDEVKEPAEKPVKMHWKTREKLEKEGKL